MGASDKCSGTNISLIILVIKVSSRVSLEISLILIILEMIDFFTYSSSAPTSYYLGFTLYFPLFLVDADFMSCDKSIFRQSSLSEFFDSS